MNEFYQSAICFLPRRWLTLELGEGATHSLHSGTGDILNNFPPLLIFPVFSALNGSRETRGDIFTWMVSGKVKGQGSVPKLALGTSVREMPLGVGKVLANSLDCVSYPFVYS